MMTFNFTTFKNPVDKNESRSSDLVDRNVGNIQENENMLSHFDLFEGPVLLPF